MADEGETFQTDVETYHEWAKERIEDIGHDTDALIRMLGDEKMGESFDSGMLAGLLSNKGIDPGILAMLDRKDGAFGSDGGLLFLLFLVILMGGNIGGWGNNGGISGVDRTVINEGNFNQLMTAITQSGASQTAAVQALAGNLNTDVAAVTGALASMDKQLAINMGDIRSAIQSCCCNIRTELQATSNATNLALERGFTGLQGQASQIAYAQQDAANRNTQSILNAITAQTAVIHDGFCDIRTRELEAEVSRLRDLNAQQRDAANTQAILTAIANMNELKGTVAGTLDTTAGTFTGTTTGTLSRIQEPTLPIPYQDPTNLVGSEAAESEPDYSDWSGMFPRGPIGGLKPLTPFR